MYVLFIIRPCQHRLPRLDEGADIVYMLIGLVVVDPAGKPKHLGHPQIFLQYLLNLLLCQPGVPSSAQQAALRHHTSPFPVHMDGAALQNEIPFVIYIRIQQIAELSRHLIVLVPRKIQPVTKAAPCVEPPVDAPDLPGGIAHKGRPIISGPRVIAGHLHHPDMRRQRRPRIVILRPAGAHRHLLRLPYGFRHLHKGPSCGIPSILPGIRPLRKYHDAALMEFKLSGHIKAVPRRRRLSDDPHEAPPSPVPIPINRICYIYHYNYLP